MKKYVVKRDKNSLPEKLTRYRAELNDEQFAVVTAQPKAALVVAGAGTGKTRAITYRVAYLIEHGVIHPEILKRELITEEELEAAARKQGYGSVSEVESATLEPGGAIAFVAREPDPDEVRHQELLGRIEKLTDEVLTLRQELGRSPAA